MKRDIKPIPLDNNQLFRFKIYKTPEQTILFSDFHHIITDGVSLDNFFKDVAKAYKGEEIESEMIDGYAYSLIEEETPISEVSEKFFKNQFAKGIESTVLTPNINGNPDKNGTDFIGNEFDISNIRVTIYIWS